MRCYVFLSLLTWRHYNTLNGNRLTGLTCSKAPGFWMVEHQLVICCNWICGLNKALLTPQLPLDRHLKLIHEAIYVHWADYMQPYEALHVYCQWLSTANNFCVKLIIVTRQILLVSIFFIIIRPLVVMYLLSFVLTYWLFFKLFFVDKTVSCIQV